MTRLAAIEGLQVTMQSQNLDLPEYDDEKWTNERWAHVDERYRTSKYVQCQADAEFRIQIKIFHPFVIDSENITFKASVDGHSICQIYCPAQHYERNWSFYEANLNAKIDRLTPTSVSRRPLKFASIIKVDDADSTRVKNDVKAIAGLGEIVVTAFRTRTIQSNYPYAPRGYGHDENLGAPKEISEKALKGKAISNGVVYGEATPRHQVSKEQFEIDGPQNPIAVFVFKYRSKEDLEAEMIIPRPRSPSPVANLLNRVPVDRRARLLNLKREIEEIKAEDGVAGPSRKKSRVILDDDDDDDDDDDIEIVSSKVYKTSRLPDGGVVVDLTDD